MEVLVPHLFAIALSAVLALAPGDTLKAPLPLTPAEADELLTSPLRHVRALHPELAAALAKGVRRSATVGFLVASLQQSDVIVQIVAAAAMPLSTSARLMLVPKPKAVRFLRIEMRVEGGEDDLIALLAHELRHAVEIADAYEVRDERALIALYRRIGHRDGGERQFDTEAAHETARQVRRELYAAAALASRQ
jgi:hypothetical protein